MTGAELARLLRVQEMPRKALMYSLGVCSGTISKWVAGASPIRPMTAYAIRYVTEYGPEPRMLMPYEVMRAYPFPQVRLAKVLGVTPKHVSWVMNGRTPMTPRFSLAVRWLAKHPQEAT